jgi:hypothetical protein
MKTYIPRQPKLARERLELKLERSLLQKLERYCEYLDSDRDYVLGCVLQVVFRKDKGFLNWLESNAPKPVGESVPVADRTQA